MTRLEIDAAPRRFRIAMGFSMCVVTGVMLAVGAMLAVAGAS